MVRAKQAADTDPGKWKASVALQRPQQPSGSVQVGGAGSISGRRGERRSAEGGQATSPPSPPGTTRRSRRRSCAPRTCPWASSAGGRSSRRTRRPPAAPGRAAPGVRRPGADASARSAALKPNGAAAHAALGCLVRWRPARPSVTSGIEAALIVRRSLVGPTAQIGAPAGRETV